MKLTELAHELHIPEDDKTMFRRAVKQLIQSGELVRLKRGRIGLPDQLGIVVGKLAVTRKGMGFLIREGEDEDIMIPAWELLTGMDGDQVMVRLRGRKQGRESGAVIKVVKRAERNIVGLLRQERHFFVVTPDNPKIHRDLYIPSGEMGGAKDGDKVVVQLVAWDDPHRNPEGKVVERIGRPSDPGVDMLTVIKSHNLPEAFPEEVLNEAEQASARLEDDSAGNRLDLTGTCIYTIDPADAKDHDDAVGVEKTPTGFRLGVHIADVSHYVKPGSPLDVEAFTRGNSVYLPGMVIPMIPEVLSNDVCSLKPDRRRLAHTVFIDFDPKGKMLRWEMADTVIQSVAKLSYEEVQDQFDGKPSPAHVSLVADNLAVARQLATLLSRRRFAGGALDFDLPESKLVLGDDGEVLELGSRERLESHRLVEEFMLAANQAVALEVFRHAQPFLYRVHDKPNEEKLVAFASLMGRLGYKFVVSKTMKPSQFSSFLDKIKDSPESDFINELLLRTMAKAVYQRENIGHFGLAFKHYTHFTSPIRRYADLLVHRLLRKLKNGRYPVAFARRVNTTIDHVSKHCSETERVAERAEREAIKVKQVSFMAKHLGDEFTGVISGVVPYGFFVRLDRLGVEGMVRVSAVDDDYYFYDEDNFRLVGRRTRRVYRLGDPVKVGILKVDTLRNEIDLFLADKKKPKLKPKKEVKKTTRTKKPRPLKLTAKAGRRSSNKKKGSKKRKAGK